MVMDYVHRADYLIVLNTGVDIQKIQRDLDICISSSGVNPNLLIAVHFYCDNDVLKQFSKTTTYVEFPRNWFNALQICTGANFTGMYEMMEGETYTKEQVIDIFHTKLAEYQQGTTFRFSKGQQERVDLILSHEAIANNVCCHFWKEAFVCE
jgi:hypothetical protein